MSQKTVSIGGVQYDAVTGLRLDGQAHAAPKPAPEKKTARASAAATSLQQKTQRTKTLKRSHVTKPVVTSKKPAALKPKTSVAEPKKSTPAQSVHRSPMIRRFAAHDIMPAKKRPNVAPVAAVVAHSTHEAAKASHATAKQSSHPSAATASTPDPQHVKHNEVKKALATSKSTTSTHTKNATHKQSSLFTRHPRLFSIATASIVVVLLAGYVTYVNLPFISVKIAAVQAGVKADYPTYLPSGYSLDGAVEYTPGTVTMKFASNSSPQSFTLTQSKSDWDSSSLLENYISPKAGDDYITLSENGLTIYRYENNAAWVNGGILHVIEGDAPLSDIQIKRIATSV